ncbi:MAG: hypothetical protein WCB27_00435 [Thermoguttaceae bacterium]
MCKRFFLVVAVALIAAGMFPQNGRTEDGVPSAWRHTGDSPAVPAAPRNIAATEAAARPVSEPAVSIGALPNDAGQVWREYDISSYTTRVTTTKRPEQAIIDWILRDTGYEVWHTDPVSMLSAGNRTLRVYHTPEMQKRVADVVERFTNSEAATYTFSMRVVTLDSPSWRTLAQRLLQPVPVRTSGLNAWLLPKENAAIMLGELRRRNDYREHSSPYLMVNNGQSTVVSAMRPRSYVRDVVPRGDLPAGFQPAMGQVDEGFALDFSPLLSVDRRMIDAAIKCEIDQVEKMIPVMIDVATPSSPRQRTKIESPQMSHYRFHERFRWPVDQTLLVGLGMVALPIPVDGAPLVQGLPLPIGNSPARADLLIFVECRGPAVSTANPAAVRPPQREMKNYRGRY